MSTGLPRRIRLLPGQSGERHYAGRLSLDALPRVAACISGDTLEVQVELELSRDHRGRRLARVAIRALVTLQCQRCMAPMDWPLTVDSVLLIADEKSAPDSGEDPDSVSLDEGTLDAVALVEDEILLALPIVALHDEDTECGRQGTETAGPQQLSAEREHPFAALAALKTKH